MSEPQTYQEFWPEYVRAHQNPINRALHVVGTLTGATLALHGLATLRPRRVLSGFAVGYAFAWVGHFVFEGNKPASFGHPLWSFRGDWEMLYRTLTGSMDAELAKHTAPAPEPVPTSTDGAISPDTAVN
jgi:hypothetical protein